MGGGALGWAFAIWGTALYWLAAALYVVQVRQILAADRAQRDVSNESDGAPANG